MPDETIPQINATIPQTEQSSEDIELLDYIEVIIKRKKLVVQITSAAIVLSIVISLLLPKKYDAIARILPPTQDQGMMGLMLGQFGGGMASLAGDILGKGTPADQYVGFLNSEVIKDAIIDRFKLMEVYNEDYRLDTYEKLDKYVDIAAGKKDGIITITVEDEEPKRAAAMANAFVEEVGKLDARLSMIGSGQNRAFYESRLAKARLELAKAEDAMKAFQSKNKTLDVPEQAKASIEGVALLRAQLAAQEVQLASLRSYLTDSSREVTFLKASIANIKKQITLLEGKGGASSIPSLGTVPSLGEEYLRLMRDFKIQETLVEILTKQFEMTKLKEANDVSGLQVIQQARVPDKKTKPKRALIVLGSTFAAFFFSVFLSFVLEYVERLPEEERSRWRRVFNTLLCRKGQHQPS
jgi:tyrosine-protein kinase Etk/Wzc